MEPNWHALVQMADEIKRCDAGNITIASMAMSFICIDALANLSRSVGKDKATRKDFIAWVDTYLVAHPDQPYQYRGKDVWAARCALLHTFSAESDLHKNDPDTMIYSYHNGGLHAIDPNIDPRLVMIGTRSFTNDVVHAIAKFMDDCRADVDLMKLIESRLDVIFSKVPFQ